MIPTVGDIKIAPPAEIFTYLHTIKSDVLKEKFLLFIIGYGCPLVVVHINIKKYTQFNCFPSVLSFFVIALKNT
jgi:hypothetical protein